MNENKMTKGAAILEVMAIITAVLMRVAKETDNMGMYRKLNENWRNCASKTPLTYIARLGQIVHTPYKIDKAHRDQIEKTLCEGLAALPVEDEFMEHKLYTVFYHKSFYMFFDQDRLDKMMKEATSVLEETA